MSEVEAVSSGQVDGEGRFVCCGDDLAVVWIDSIPAAVTPDRVALVGLHAWTDEDVSRRTDHSPGPPPRRQRART